MSTIRIPLTLSPHIADGKPRGYYVLAQRLFPRGAPTLLRHQWIGFDSALVITVDHPPQDNTLLSMAIRHAVVDGRPTSWLAPAKLWTMSMGFKSYIPGTILKPEPAEAKKIETTGVFKKAGELYILRIPLLDGEILLGRKSL